MIKVINKLTRTKLSDSEIIDFYKQKHLFLESFPTFNEGARVKTSTWTAYTAGRRIDLNTGYDWLITSDNTRNNLLNNEQKQFLKKYGVGLANQKLNITGHCVHYLINKEMESYFRTSLFFFHINDSYNDMNINIVIFEKDDRVTLQQCRNANDNRAFTIQ